MSFENQAWVRIEQALPRLEIDVLVTDGKQIYIASLWEDCFGNTSFIHPEINLNGLTHWICLPELPQT